MVSRSPELIDREERADIESQSLENSTPRLLLAGIDSLYVGYYVDFGDGLSITDLIETKEILRQERSDLREIAIGSESFGLLP